MTVPYLQSFENDVGYDALLEKIIAQEVCIISKCIVCYGYDVPVLVRKQPTAKSFYSLFTYENHFSLPTLCARGMIEVSAIIIPFLTQRTMVPTCRACRFMCRAMLTCGLGNHLIRAVSATIEEHALEIIKNKMMRCLLLRLV